MVLPACSVAAKQRRTRINPHQQMQVEISSRCRPRVELAQAPLDRARLRRVVGAVSSARSNPTQPLPLSAFLQPLLHPHSRLLLRLPRVEMLLLLLHSQHREACLVRNLPAKLRAIYSVVAKQVRPEQVPLLDRLRVFSAAASRTSLQEVPRLAFSPTWVGSRADQVELHRVARQHQICLEVPVGNNRAQLPRLTCSQI